MNEESLTAEKTMARLRDNASCLAAVASRLPAERLDTAPEPDAWSPKEVLAHIRACCDVWGENMARFSPRITRRSPAGARGRVNERTLRSYASYPGDARADARAADRACRDDGFDAGRYS